MKLRRGSNDFSLSTHGCPSGYLFLQPTSASLYQQWGKSCRCWAEGQKNWGRAMLRSLVPSVVSSAQFHEGAVGMQLPAGWMHAKSRLQEFLPHGCSKCGLCAAFQIHVKRGDHMKGARMLIRVANNISKFPSRKCWQQRSCALRGQLINQHCPARFILPCDPVGNNRV